MLRFTATANHGRPGQEVLSCGGDTDVVASGNIDQDIEGDVMAAGTLLDHAGQQLCASRSRQRASPGYC